MTAQIPADHAPNWSVDLRQFLQVEHNADGTLIRGNPAALLRVITAAYAATVTPNAATTDILDVGALTGNITIANPTGSPVDGQQLRLVMSQDATGGRTVTFGTGYLFGTDVTTGLIPTTANAKWELVFGWNAADSKWRARQITRIVGGSSAGGSQTLTQVLTLGNDAGGFKMVNGAAATVGTDFAIFNQIPQQLTITAVKTGAYTLAPGEFAPLDTTSGAVTATLPAAPTDGTCCGAYLLTKGGSNNGTLAAGGSDVIRKAGTTSLTFSIANAGSIAQYKGGIWHPISTLA